MCIVVRGTGLKLNLSTYRCVRLFPYLKMGISSVYFTGMLFGLTRQCLCDRCPLRYFPMIPTSWDLCAPLEYGLDLVTCFQCIEYGKSYGAIFNIHLQKDSDFRLACLFLLTLMKANSHIVSHPMGNPGGKKLPMEGQPTTSKGLRPLVQHELSLANNHTSEIGCRSSC